MGERSEGMEVEPREGKGGKEGETKREKGTAASWSSCSHTQETVNLL